MASVQERVSAFQALVSVRLGHACLLTGRLDDAYALATQAHALSQRTGGEATRPGHSTSSATSL